LEDITEDDLAGSSGSLVHRNNEEIIPATPVAEVRRSSRVSRPPERFSPSLHYLICC
jgi:hypothetical protein